MPTLYPVGYGNRLVPLDELRAIHVAHMHPEFDRRLFAWLESRDGQIGIGGGYRITQPVRPGFAPAGKSFHQDQRFASGFVGYCAVDLVARNGNDRHRAPTWPEVPAQGTRPAQQWGVHCNVGTEAWHMQPVEIDGWQTWVDNGRPDPRVGYPLPSDPPPPEPTPPPPTVVIKESLMYTVFKKSNGGYCFGRLGEWWYHIGTPEVTAAAVAGGAIDLKTGSVVTGWSQVGVVPDALYLKVMGLHRGDNF